MVRGRGREVVFTSRPRPRFVVSTPAVLFLKWQEGELNEEQSTMTNGRLYTDLSALGVYRNDAAFAVHILIALADVSAEYFHNIII